MKVVGHMSTTTRDSKTKIKTSRRMEFAAVYIYGRQLRRERRFRDHLDPLDVSDEVLVTKYRFLRAEIVHLCEQLGPQLERTTLRSHAILVQTQVLLALHFYASGNFQSVIGGSMWPNTGECRPSAC